MIDDGLPIIDLSSVSSQKDLRAIGKQLVASIETIGFFYVVGHGIDPTLMKMLLIALENFSA